MNDSNSTSKISAAFGPIIDEAPPAIVCLPAHENDDTSGRVIPNLASVPEISRFFGIVIQMYVDDHNPPHFHARYAGSEAKVRIEPPGVMAGTFPPREMSLVLEWAARYNPELMDNWSRLQSKQPVRPIPPLE